MRYPTRFPSDSLRARLSRLVSPSYGACLRCGMSWRFATSHTTYVANGRGCFPLCERCWAVLPTNERLPFYWRLFALWDGRGGSEARQAIEDAVTAEAVRQ